MSAPTTTGTTASHCPAAEVARNVDRYLASLKARGKQQVQVELLNGTIVSSKLPFVLPRYEYSYFGQPDAWGGRLSLETGVFNVMRTDGTNTRRANLTLNYERPFTGMLGDLWKVTLHGDAARFRGRTVNINS